MKILIAEDDIQYGAFLTYVLGEDVLWVQDGQSLYEKYLEYKPDLMLVDLIMPIMGGDEAIREIRRNDKDSLILVLTQSVYLYHQVRDNVQGYLLKFKETDIRKLVEIINTCDGDIGERPYMRRVLAEQFGNSDLTPAEIKVKNNYDHFGGAKEQIAKVLCVCMKTVDKHLDNMAKKGYRPRKYLVKQN